MESRQLRLLLLGPDDQIDFIEGPQPYAVFKSVVESMLNS